MDERLVTKMSMNDSNLNDMGAAEAVPVETKVSYRPSFSGGTSISLRCLFQIVTGCGVFFAVLRVSPMIAIFGTIIIAPAIIRTGLAAEGYQLESLPFGIKRRITVFMESLGVVLLTAVFAGSVFLVISFLFGILGMLFGSAVSNGDLSYDVAVVGTAGGMIWGMAGALLAIGYSAYTTWLPEVPKR